MATPNVPVQAAPRMTAQQQDAIATRAILSTAVDRIQMVESSTVYPASNPVLITQPINVGLVKRFTIHVKGHITNTGTTELTLTDWGLSNIFGQGGVQYADLNNYLRVNTSGQHLTVLANAKRRRSYGSTIYYPNGEIGAPNQDNMSQMLNVLPCAWGVFHTAQTIDPGVSQQFSAYFELPLAYTDDDLRGAIWANVLNAVQQITLTFNQQAVTADPQDSNWAVYSGPAGSQGAITDVQVVILQEYLDQLPKTNSNGTVTTVLPALSLSTVYELKSTIFSSLSANQEFYIPYANQRSFISTFATYNGDGTSAGRHGFQGQVSYWALLAANASYIWKMSPTSCVLKFTREHLQQDLPMGCYYFPSRRRNLATLQFGNLQLTINPVEPTPASYVNVMWESFALQNTLSSGASLASS